MADFPANTSQEAGVAASDYNAEQVQLIRNICAKDCTMSEFQLLLHLAKTYGLDPLSRQIWAVKYPGSAAHIFCGRDGLLAIAHRSGQFDGIESGVRKDEDSKFIGWAKVFRKDMSRPFSIEVYEEEYNTNKSVWKTKPRTMIQKVAEAQALRRAFSITGLYSPEEMGSSEHLSGPADMSAVSDPNACSVCGCLVEANLQEKIQAETGGKPMCRACFNKWWEDKKKAEIQEEFTAEVKPAETEPKHTTLAVDTKPTDKTNEATPAEVPESKPTPRENLTNCKCESCGELISKSELNNSQFLLGEGRFMCKPCMAQLRKDQQKKVADAKKKNATETSKPAEKPAGNTGLVVCEQCGAEVPENVASMAKMFAGKVLCQKCLAAFHKGGAQ